MSASVTALASMMSFAEAQPLEALDNDPAMLTEAFVRGRINPAEAAFTGEAAANPVSQNRLPKAPQVAVEELWRGEDRALVAIEFSNSISAEDLYAFLVETEEGWRIEAFRAFELPGVYYQQLNRYRNQGEASIRRDYEATWERSRSKGVSQAQHEGVHGTIEDRLFYVFNLRLASSADADLVRHFEFLRKRFDAAREQLAMLPQRPLAYGHDVKELGAELQYLLVKRAYHEADSPLRFEIANVEGDDVGYLYCPDAGCMPTPTPGGVIALRKLGDGWYLYRTT